MARSTEVFVANDDFAAEIDGEMYVCHKGKTRVRAGHVLLKDGREKLFDSVDDAVHYESATTSSEPAKTPARSR
jgi:hypothetical protein